MDSGTPLLGAAGLAGVAGETPGRAGVAGVAALAGREGAGLAGAAVTGAAITGAEAMAGAGLRKMPLPSPLIVTRTPLPVMDLPAGLFSGKAILVHEIPSGETMRCPKLPKR